MKDNNILTDEDLNEVYGWVDSHELSRPKKNIGRDFSDGLMVAEIVKKHFEKIVDLHNYPSTHNVKQKFTNWDTLNRKVFTKLGFQLKSEEIDKIVNCKPDAVEKCLLTLKKQIEETKLRPPVVEKKPFPPTPQPNYTNVVSPIDTPTHLAMNQHFQVHLYNPQTMPAMSMQPVMRPGNYPIPPDTPISRVPPPKSQERRRSPVMQRAGMQATAGLQEENYGQPRPKKPVEVSQYQSLSNKQLIDILKDRDTRIQDLVDAVEILELKGRKLEQLVQIKDAELRVWQNK